MRSQSKGIGSQHGSHEENRVIGLLPSEQNANDQDPLKIEVQLQTAHPIKSKSRRVSPNDPPPSSKMEPKDSPTERNGNGIPESIPQKPSLSSRASIDPLNVDQDEIVQSPVQEDFEPRIQFGDLPRPPPTLGDSASTLPSDFNPQYVVPSVDEVGLRGRRRRSGPTSMSDDEFQPRLLHRMSTGIRRPITRVISNTIGRRNMEERFRLGQRQATLPYLTFAPTIGRNSVATPSPSFIGLLKRRYSLD